MESSQLKQYSEMYVLSNSHFKFARKFETMHAAARCFIVSGRNFIMVPGIHGDDAKIVSDCKLCYIHAVHLIGHIF